MSITDNFKKNVIKKSRLQDILFISGILFFTAALVLGLFPESSVEVAEKEYFTFLLMIIPVIAAIYFIFIAFSRKIYSNSYNFSSSIVFKMMLAFISVAILPSLTIIIISNQIINTTISNLITDKTTLALSESIKLSNDYIESFYNDIDGELKSLDYAIKKRNFNPASNEDRSILVKNNKFKGISSSVYKVLEKNTESNKISLLVNSYKHVNSLTKYYQNADLESMLRISNLSIGDSTILLGQLYSNGYIISIIKDIPEKIYQIHNVYKDSLKSFNKAELLKPYFHTEIGIFLLSVAILIILISISVSFFLSRSFTKPMLELAEATGHVASGDFHIKLSRESSDELDILFKSFNKMVKQLDESREIVYHAQKLEAWRDVARRLVHEIKNPLTPIQLSAERIQNRFREGHPGIHDIVNSGTETIIEEVKVLNRILDEFSGFARLPEMNGEYQNINPLIENCVNFFLGHEGITFHLNLDKTIPKLFFDKVLIRQALTNILQNSIDAAGSEGNIYISSGFSDEKHSNVRISIKDDGPGIEPENLGKVFEPTFSTKDTGTGLGLAIVEKIVLEHNGKIFCNSKAGYGAEFIIILPVLEEDAVGKNTAGR